MQILIAYFSQTKNTEKIAAAICETLISRDHHVELVKVEDIKSNTLDDYDLLFIGSACQDADIAYPAIQLLEGIDFKPAFKLAAFVTHSTSMPYGSERNRELYQEWAGKCLPTITQLSEEKGFELLGYFHCQGKPAPEIAQFIHYRIIPEKAEWSEYIEEVNKHPDDDDLKAAGKFAEEILDKYSS